MKTKKLSKGFTLIELLVVIAIIGILGAIIYAPFQSARRKGRDAQRVIEMKNLVSTITLYADSNGGNFPCSMEVLKDSLSDSLPKNVNLGIAEDLTKYNYAAYSASSSCVGGAAKGFHLWTHLETVSGALDGAAKCKGFIASQPTGTTTSACANFGSGATMSLSDSGVDEDNSEAMFLSADRVPNPTQNPTEGDADAVCATQTNYCILDYHQ
ncbi:MAG: ral secretion pathway protein [Patescibacteria group bacterium]|nr:ral secretion pathway protein [Patescibacteria group bacterium]